MLQSLEDAEFRVFDLNAAAVAMGLTKADVDAMKPRSIGEGLYVLPHFSFEHTLVTSLSFEQCYPEFADDAVWAYGVCDSPEQFMTKVGGILKADPRSFVVSFAEICKGDDGGWRWHKWGPYIGEKTPRFEYIRAEGPEIMSVWCYHIFDVSPDAYALAARKLAVLSG